jgi:hypothetical protein
MAALGYRGRVEIRDQGLPVDLTEHTATPWQLSLAAAQPPPPIAKLIRETTSLGELEAVFEKIYHINEIDYDRRKAASLSSETPPGRSDTASFLQAASDRGTQWVTRRRLREATGELPDSLASTLLIPTTLIRQL